MRILKKICLIKNYKIYLMYKGNNYKRQDKQVNKYFYIFLIKYTIF